jgi:hypothetical protein
MSAKQTVNASPVSANQVHPASQMTLEAFRVALDRGFDKVYKEVYSEPWQGQAFIRDEKVGISFGKDMEILGYGGTVEQNRDADTIPFASKAIGFPTEWQTYVYRKAIGFERSAIEQDQVGNTKDAQKEMLDMSKRAKEYCIADHFNRAFGTAGAPRLAPDGMYYIDDARPNPDANGGAWSNLEATADLTENTLFTASYNARQQVGPNGNKYPQRIKKIMIPPSWEQKMWKLLNTDKVLGNDHNDANWAAGVFKMSDVIVYDYLETDAIFYWLCDPKSADNKLVMKVRVKPEVQTGWGAMPNPDTLFQRIREDWGIALGDPRKSIRGGLLLAAS